MRHWHGGHQLSLPAVSLHVQRSLVGTTCGHCLSSVGLHRVFKYSVHRMPLDLTVDSWYTGRVQSTEHLRAQVGSPYGVLPTASRTDQTQ